MRAGTVVRLRVHRSRNAVRHDLFARLDRTPERGDLDDFGTESYMRESEAAADDPAVPKELLDLIRMRRGADIEVLGATAGQQIANAAAHQIGDVIVLAQAIEDFQRVGI